MPSMSDISPMQNFPLGLVFARAMLILPDLMGLNTELLSEGFKQWRRLRLATVLSHSSAIWVWAYQVSPITSSESFWRMARVLLLLWNSPGLHTGGYTHPCQVPPSLWMGFFICCNSQEMVCGVWVGPRGRSVTTHGRSCCSARSQPAKGMVLKGEVPPLLPSCSTASLGDAQVVPSRSYLEVILPLILLHWCNLFHCRISENSQESVLMLT